MRSSVGWLLLVTACSSSPVELQSEVDVVTDAYLAQGVTCDTVEMFTGLSGDQKQAVVDVLIAEGGSNVFDELLQLGGGCMLEERLAMIAAEPAYDDWQVPSVSGQSARTSHIGAGTHVVEHIESNLLGSAGSAPSGIYGDGSVYGWMCGSPAGTPESPVDFISLTYLSGSYNNRSGLKVKPKNLWSTCYLLGGVDARVYTDHDIAACIASGMVLACAAVIPLTSDFTTRY